MLVARCAAEVCHNLFFAERLISLSRYLSPTVEVRLSTEVQKALLYVRAVGISRGLACFSI